MSTIIELSVIKFGRKKLELKEPIRIRRSYTEGYCILKYKPIKLFAYDKGYKKALECFQEEFIALYEHYVKGNPNKMIGYALVIREHLSKIVKVQGGIR